MSTATDKPGLARLFEYRDRLAGIIGMLEGAPEPNPVMIATLKLVHENDLRVIEAIEKDLPLVQTWYGNCQEIVEAMGFQFMNPIANMLLHLNFTNLHDLEEADKTAWPADICSLIRLGAYAVQKGLTPTPTAVVAMLEPCDGQAAIHEAWANSEAWKGVPMFALDPPYGQSEADYTYFAGELRRMIAFLEEVHGVKLDWDRLRAVIQETNRQYEAWSEYNDLRRAVPCPHPSFVGGTVGWAITQHIRAGHPGATALLRAMASDAEQKVKAGVGPMPKERIRIVWADLLPTWADELGAWLAEEWGASVVMDFQGYTPYRPIDTATEESMLFGLARRCTDEVPMIRQARGDVTVMTEDIIRIVKDYKCDCVFFPGHMGHKDQSASLAFIKETCREHGVPLLAMTTSIFDPRYTPMDTLKRQISEFFLAHGLGGH